MATAKKKRSVNAKARVVTNRPGSRIINLVSRNKPLTVLVAAAIFAIVGSATIMWVRAATITTSLWANNAVPKLITSPDTKSVELGVKFKSKFSGQVTGVRFYKGPQNTGTHTGSLWTTSGTKLASATFTNETASGWQQASFPKPVAISAQTTYVISYFAPKGRYSANTDYFKQKSYSNANAVLTAPRSSAGNGNGVYIYGAKSAFPTQSYQASNYWVDPVFSYGVLSSTKPEAPTKLAATRSNATVTLAWTNSISTGVIRHDIYRNNTLLAPSVSGSYVDNATTPGTTYTYHVVAVDGSGQASNPSNTVSISVPVSTTPIPTPTPTPTPPPSANCTTGVWSNLETCGWPGSTNTGYPAGSSLTATTGRTISASNSVVNGEKITGRVRITGQNVTIKNSWIISTGGGTNGTGVIELAPGASATIDHVTIDGGNNAHSCIWHRGASMTMTAVNCFNVNDGIFSWQDSGGTSQGNNFTIQDSYIHNLTTATGNGHVDGYQTEGASNGIIRHNTFDISQDQTSAISIWNSQKSSDNITVDNNLLAGGGFTIYAEDYVPSEANPAGGFTVTNISFINNRFSRHYYGCIGYWGIWYPRGSPSDQWRRSGNTIIETGASVDTGNPTYNGAPCS